MIGQLSFVGMPPKPKTELSQWFTHPKLARRIVRWAGARPGMRVLEPSAGSGAFVDPLLEQRGVTVDAVELDPEWAHYLEHEHRGRDLVVHSTSFTAWKPGCRFSMAVANPPYEDGQDLDHTVHALSMSDRVVALVRLVFLAGEERYERMWAHHTLRRLILFRDRPRFSGAGSPRHDFCVVEITHGTPEGGHQPAVEWWRAGP